MIVLFKLICIRIRNPGWRWADVKSYNSRNEGYPWESLLLQEGGQSGNTRDVTEAYIQKDSNCQTNSTRLLNLTKPAETSWLLRSFKYTFMKYLTSFWDSKRASLNSFGPIRRGNKYPLWDRPSNNRYATYTCLTEVTSFFCLSLYYATQQ